MADEAQIRARLEKIKALFAGAATPGERQAAQAAMERVQQQIAVPTPRLDDAHEYRFSLANPWSYRLFLALCRARGYRPYRYPRMRRTSVCVRIRPWDLDRFLWPEYQEMNQVLTDYLGELANHIIADCINGDRSDADMVAGLPAPTAMAEMNG